MGLTEEDKKFLDEVGKQLEPELPPFDAIALMDIANTLRWLWEAWGEEIVSMSNAMLQTSCPVLEALGKDNPIIVKELLLFRDQLVMHVMARTWQVAKHND